MKPFSVSSFALGLGSGVVILLLVFGGMRLVGGGRQRAFGGPNAGNFQRMNGGAPDMAALAERFGMTEAELRAEIDSGKTMREIAKEHGADFAGGRGMMGGPRATASGTTASAAASAAAQPSSAQR